MEVFVGLVTSDGYKKMLSYLQGDPQVRVALPAHNGDELDTS